MMIEFENRPRQAKRPLFTAIGLLSTLLCANFAMAQDSFEPLLESLQVKQKQEAQQAAPNGQDSGSRSDDIDLEIQVPKAIIQDVSELAKQAEEKIQEIDLTERKQTQALEKPLEQFGYAALANVSPSASVTSKTAKVPADYRVGPGDNLVVQVYGKRNVEYDLVVTREGQILVPEFGPIDVAGLTFAEITDVIDSNFSERVIGANTAVTMGEVRNIQIRMTGDVINPGVYPVSGLSTLVDALFSTGGIKYSGSLRNIKLKRNGSVVSSIDLYDLLLRGDSRGDVLLQPNDVIFVAPIGKVVSVGGEVQRPAIYEIRHEKTADEMIKLAGGLLPNASLENSHIERILSGKYRTLINAWSKNATSTERKASQKLSNGDFIRVLPMDEMLDGVVLLQGEVKRPGGFPFKQGMRVSDLIPDHDALLPGADLSFALIKREAMSTGETQVKFVNLEAALKQRYSSADPLLQGRDTVIAFKLKTNRSKVLEGIVETLRAEAADPIEASVFAVTGYSKYSGVFPLEKSVRLLDALSISGGVLSGTDMVYGLLARTEPGSNKVSASSFSLKEAKRLPNGENNPMLRPGDRIYLFDKNSNRTALMSKDISTIIDQTSYRGKDRTVRVNGRVQHEGRYPLEKDMRLSDLVCAAGGIDEKGFGLGAELSRYVFNPGERTEVIHIPVDAQEIIRLCASMHMFGYPYEGKYDERLARYLDDERNPKLVPHDELTFVEKPDWADSSRVVLSGEVMRPGVYVIERNETLCQVIERASGLTPNAYTFGAEFTRSSVKQLQQETLDSIQDQLDDLLVELSMSHSARNNEKTPAGNSKDEYIRIIKQLERATPSGRMVIDLDGVLKCSEKARVVLLDGDKLHVPTMPQQVYVSGQVYVPTSHMYRADRRAQDYVDLSGGATVLGRLKDAYVLQANGEVNGLGKKRKSRKVLRSKVLPGAKIIVPLNVDRMNPTERAQSWTKVFLETAILAGVLL